MRLDFFVNLMRQTNVITLPLGYKYSVRGLIIPAPLITCGNAPTTLLSL